MRLLLLALITLSIQAKLLDKISAVVNDEVVTLSMINRINESMPARKAISPFIYTKDSYQTNEVVDLVIRKFIIRSKLKEMGISIDDSQVESEIKDREHKLGLTRTQLLAFLERSKTNFEEFFEITREAIEFNVFNSRIIIPLISVSEQEIKNQFFKENINNKTISYKYTLVNFTIDTAKVPKSEYQEFKKTMTDFQKGAPLPKKYSAIEATTLGDITEEGLSKEILTVLKKTSEGEFTDPINFNGNINIFFVKNRDVVESELFATSKNRIHAKLFEQKAIEVTNVWFDRESSNYYVNKF